MSLGEAAERIASRCEPVPVTGCWLWTGAANDRGYGMTQFEGRSQYTHRIAYRAAKGPIPDGLEIDHLCRVRLCANPAHLEAVTHAENNRRMGVALQARKTHCKRGHRLTPENTMRSGPESARAGHRNCLRCRRDDTREYRKRRQPYPGPVHNVLDAMAAGGELRAGLLLRVRGPGDTSMRVFDTTLRHMLDHDLVYLARHESGVAVYELTPPRA